MAYRGVWVWVGVGGATEWPGCQGGGCRRWRRGAGRTGGCGERVRSMGGRWGRLMGGTATGYKEACKDRLRVQGDVGHRLGMQGGKGYRLGFQEGVGNGLGLWVGVGAALWRARGTRRHARTPLLVQGWCLRPCRGGHGVHGGEGGNSSGVQGREEGQTDQGCRDTWGTGWGCRKARETAWASRKVWVWVGMVSFLLLTSSRPSMLLRAASRPVNKVVRSVASGGVIRRACLAVCAQQCSTGGVLDSRGMQEGEGGRLVGAVMCGHGCWTGLKGKGHSESEGGARVCHVP